MVPTLSDGVVILNGHTDDDVAEHFAGEDEETARRFGWWPQRSTEDTVRGIPVLVTKLGDRRADEDIRYPRRRDRAPPRRL